MTSARPRGAGLEPFEDLEPSCTSALEVFGRGIFEEDLFVSQGAQSVPVVLTTAFKSGS